jgi:hypothetical protein
MQINATLIAAQQAAREAQARFQATHVASPQSAAKTGFSAVLQSEAGFAPLPLKQVAPAAAIPAPATRLGSQLDITI